MSKYSPHRKSWITVLVFIRQSIFPAMIRLREMNYCTIRRNFRYALCSDHNPQAPMKGVRGWEGDQFHNLLFQFRAYALSWVTFLKKVLYYPKRTLDIVGTDVIILFAVFVLFSPGPSKYHIPVPLASRCFCVIPIVIMACSTPIDRNFGSKPHLKETRVMQSYIITKVTSQTFGKWE